MHIRPIMHNPGHAPHPLPARRRGEPEFHRDWFSYPSEWINAVRGTRATAWAPKRKGGSAA
jgi:hypothetical protein